jgi:nicotinate-nucleotide adenylyltransferase
LKNHEIYVYPRVFTIQEDAEILANGALTENPFASHPNVHICTDAPVMRISASFIRQAIKERKDIRYLLTEPVHQYIEEMHFYR